MSTVTTQAYFIVDDVINERGTVGFILMYGDPVTAIGTEQRKEVLLLHIKDYLRSRLKPGEVVYRVKLARRHGRHTIRTIEI